MSNVIPTTHLHEVCKIGQGEATCRFIGQRLPEGDFRCLKGDLISVVQIQARQDAGTMGAKGDNCDGIGETRQEREHG